MTKAQASDQIARDCSLQCERIFWGERVLNNSYAKLESGEVMQRGKRIPALKHHCR